MANLINRNKKTADAIDKTIQEINKIISKNKSLTAEQKTFISSMTKNLDSVKSNSNGFFHKDTQSQYNNFLEQNINSLNQKEYKEIKENLLNLREEISQSQEITLTDGIHFELFKMSQMLKKDQNMFKERREMIEQEINSLGKFLVSPKVNNDAKLVEGFNNKLKPSLDERIGNLKKNGLDNFATELENIRLIVRNPELYVTIKEGNRFENQRKNIAVNNFKNHDTKPSERFFSIAKKEEGLNKGSLNFKRIVEPGNIEPDGKTITIGKEHKKFSESKYINLGMDKYSERKPHSLRQIFSYVNSKYGNQEANYRKSLYNSEFYADQNEKLISDILEKVNPEQHYKIRKINKDGAMQVKFLKNSKSLADLSKENKFDINKIYKSIDKQSLVDTTVTNFLLGISDRINTNNTMIKDKKIIPIDYTRLTGNIHNDRYERFAKAIKNKDIRSAKEILIEDMYYDLAIREDNYKAKDFTNQEKDKYLNDKFGLMLKITKKALDETPDDKFLETVTKFTTPEKVEHVQNSYNQWAMESGYKQMNVDSKTPINQNIANGFKIIGDAVNQNLNKNNQINHHEKNNTNLLSNVNLNNLNTFNPNGPENHKNMPNKLKPTEIPDNTDLNKRSTLNRG